jgi:hypothetical protein
LAQPSNLGGDEVALRVARMLGVRGADDDDVGWSGGTERRHGSFCEEDRGVAAPTDRSELEMRGSSMCGS